MNITSTQRNGFAAIVLEGDVDLSCSSALRKELLERTFERCDIVVDLSRVGYIDSSGIAGLVEAYQGARANGTRFILAAPSVPVLRVLRLARLDRVFTIVESVEPVPAVAATPGESLL
ncbi:STAS domain-containing protein [Magnetospirillum molischianum]|uniref:Anti-sigma factor antagonist n=1 Tax=Magnetospirillum molischianum DSM 120 TaxID=1150626 RepID=H8FRW3_MAGML|nr:STAS domain-containing protein [Magnetospirillum molischianum]CCG41101.1 Anti-sigma factor antagonist [Magnetospirillum molischianum DSM 120]